jgi:hypothetical protein
MDFLDSATCKDRKMCRVCRFSKPWRTEQSAPEECPNGVTRENAPVIIAPPPDPSLLEKAKSFPPPDHSLLHKASLLAHSIAPWAINGFKLVDEETLASRMEICKGCEFWDAAGFVGTGRCQKCGCSTQAKLRMATSKCPEGKW